MFYADDTQLWIPVKENNPLDLENCINKISSCIQEISNWMLSNKLKLNPNKTELIYIRSPFLKTVSPNISLTVDNITISPSLTVRNLGFTFDNNFMFHQQISCTLKAGYLHMRNIKSISKYLDAPLCETLIHAFITSKIDYCNSIYINMPKSQINRLQKFKNSAARLLTRTSRRDHITPVLQSLHWLPILYRTMFKVLLLAYKCVNNTAPPYLASLLSIRQSARTTRQSNSFTLVVPRSRRVNFGGRSFSVAAPKLFNSLPLTIRQCSTTEQFKARLKTHLFQSCFQN